MNRSEFVTFMRNILQDSPHMNSLLQGEELKDKTIDACVQLALADFNATPPIFTNYTVESFPAYAILVYGSLVECITMAGIVASRNRLNYNAGGVQVDVNAKAGDYMSWVSMLIQRYRDLKIQYKMSMSIQGAYNEAPSEYALAGLGAILGNLNGDQLERLNS